MTSYDKMLVHICKMKGEILFVVILSRCYKQSARLRDYFSCVRSGHGGSMLRFLVQLFYGSVLTGIVIVC